MDGSDAPSIETARTYVIELVDPADMPHVWPHVNRRIQSYVERSDGRATMESTLERLLKREFQLWLVGNPSVVCGAVMTHVSVTDSGMKLCEILACMGEDATQWVHLLEQIEAWARQNGCHRVQAWARKGWAKRLPAYRLTHVLLEKDL